MSATSLQRQAPGSGEALAALLREAGEAGSAVRITGGGTKLSWGGQVRDAGIELSTDNLDRLVEHNAGDLTAVLEAGVPLARAQETFAAEGQMLSLDPPDDGATVGGVVASGDSGPLRSRYGGVRDLVVGMRVALSDGTLAKSGGKVIKNVAGYDLAKLFGGSFGTLGAIVEVSVRLHPLPPDTATALGAADDPGLLARAAAALGRAPLEHQGFDVRWSDGRGALLMRFAGAAPRPQAQTAERLLSEAGLRGEIVDDDEGIWAEQRGGQRASGEQGVVVRVSGLPTRLPALLRAAERLGGSVVGRAGLGLSWLRLPELSADGLDSLRRELHPSPCAVLDRPLSLELDGWGPVDPGMLQLMRRVKQGFDPAGVCNPGVGLV